MSFLREAMATLFTAVLASSSPAVERLPVYPTWGKFQQTIEWPWIAIGRVNIPTLTESIFCTGVLVHPRIVLTAAQCVHVGFEVGPKQKTYKVLSPERIYFQAGVHQRIDHGHSVVADIRISPSYRPSDPRRVSAQGDWALLVLRDPLAIRPLRVVPQDPDTVRRLSDAGSISQAGYGWDRPMAMSVNAPCPVDPIGDLPLYTIACLTTFGYAGAPLLVARNGEEPFVIAIGSPSPWIIGMGNPGRRGPPPDIRNAYACPAASFVDAIQKLKQELEP